VSGRPCSTGSSSEELRLRLDVFLLDASVSPLDPFMVWRGRVRLRPFPVRHIRLISLLDDKRLLTSARRR